MKPQTEIDTLPNSYNNESDILAHHDKRRLESPDTEPDKYIKVEESSSPDHPALEKLRKKPGRKPSTAEPANKRLAQNRAAQRAFRERKDNYVKELEAKVQELEDARRQAEEENKLLQKKLSTFQGDSETNDSTTTKNSSDYQSSTKKEAAGSEGTNSTGASPNTAKNSEGTYVDNSLESWTSPENSNSTTTHPNDQSHVATPSNGNLDQNNSFQVYPENLSTNPSGFSFNDYMIPFGSALSQNPLIDYNSGMGTTTPGLMGFDGYGNTSDLAFDPSMFNYGGVPGTEFPTNFSDFNPVMYADYIQAYDPYNMVVLPTPTPAPTQMFDPITGMSVPPTGSESSTNTSTTSDQLPCQDIKKDPSEKLNVDSNLLQKAEKAAEEFDLDSLCSMLKDKATCQEIKQFYKSHCKNPAA